MKKRSEKAIRAERYVGLMSDYHVDRAKVVVVRVGRRRFVRRRPRRKQ